MNKTNTVTENVQKYYGETLETKDDLKTSACCLADTLPKYLRPLIKNIHDKVLGKFYGCGSHITYAVE